MKIIDEIKNELSFEQVFEDVCTSKKKYSRYECPFCHKKSFSILSNEYGYCHNKECGWAGDLIQLISDIKDMDFKESVKEIIEIYDLEIDISYKIDWSSISRTIEKTKAVKLYYDLAFITQFKIMVSVLDIKQDNILKYISCSRKSLYLVLAGKKDDSNISHNRWNVIIALMKRFYNKKKDEFISKSELWLNDSQIENIKRINEYLKQIE